MAAERRKWDVPWTESLPVGVVKEKSQAASETLVKDAARHLREAGLEAPLIQVVTKHLTTLLERRDQEFLRDLDGAHGERVAHMRREVQEGGGPGNI